jgi:hypothetical protein
MPSLFFENATSKEWTGTRVQLDHNPGTIIYSHLYSSCTVDDTGKSTTLNSRFNLISGQSLFLNSSAAYTLSRQPNYLLMIACPSQDNYSMCLQCRQ